jgi:chromosome segregation ATPase
VIKNKPPVSPREGAFRSEKPDLKGKVDAMESKLAYYWDELNRVKTTLGDKSKAVDRLESLLAQANASNESNLQRLRIELKSQIGDIHTLLDQQSEDPEALKNVTSLKVVVMKLQRDFRELAAGMDKGSRAEPPANATFEPESPIEDLLLSSSAPRDVPQLLKRHEAEIRHISSQISLLTDEINDLQLAAKRHSEASSQAYLRYMEDVKTEMEGILSKVNDGLKLSQRDFEKIAELFEMVGSKGDRVDLEGKAGKEDLKRAAHLLAHRVRGM